MWVWCKFDTICIIWAFINVHFFFPSVPMYDDLSGNHRPYWKLYVLQTQKADLRCFRQYWEDFFRISVHRGLGAVTQEVFVLNMQTECNGIDNTYSLEKNVSLHFLQKLQKRTYIICCSFHLKLPIVAVNTNSFYSFYSYLESNTFWHLHLSPKLHNQFQMHGLSDIVKTLNKIT